jgi:hypothetical protein
VRWAQNCRDARRRRGFIALDFGLGRIGLLLSDLFQPLIETLLGFVGFSLAGRFSELLRTFLPWLKIPSE